MNITQSPTAAIFEAGRRSRDAVNDREDAKAKAQAYMLQRQGEVAGAKETARIMEQRMKDAQPSGFEKFLGGALSIGTSFIPGLKLFG